MASSILEELPSASQYRFCITQKGEGEITHIFPVNHVPSMINMPAVKFCGKGKNKVNTEPCKNCLGRLSSLFRSRKKSPRRRPMHSLPLPFALSGEGYILQSKQREVSLPLWHPLYLQTRKTHGPGGGGRGRETWQPGFAAPPLYIFGKRSSGFPNINFLERLGEFVVWSTFYSVWWVYESSIF